MAFAPKMDGTLSVHVEYLNDDAVTGRASYQEPGMDKSIASLDDAEIFITFEALSRCWQIQLDGSRSKRNPIHHTSGTVWFIRTLFELRNVPRGFQSTIGIARTTLRW